VQETPRPPRGELIVHPTKSQRGPSTVLYLEPLSGNFGADEGRSLGFEAWRVIRQKLPWLVGLVILGFMGGFVVSLCETPQYDSRVTLEIQNPTEGTANLQIGDGAAISPESYLPTQVEILQSRTLHKRAIARLANDTFQSGFQKTGRLDSLRRLLHLTPEAPPSGSHSIPPVHVTVQPSVNTRIVQINCESVNPQAAAAYANALANEYIDSNLQARWDAINHARQWLAQQLEDTRAKLQSSEDQLLAYGRASNLMFTGDKENAEEEKLKQIQAALSDAEADRIAKQSAYRIASSTPADTVPQVIDNAQLTQYQAQLADLKRQLAELEAEYTPEHPKVKRVQAQIDQLQSTFLTDRGNILTRIRSEYQAALMKENLLAAAYRQQAQVVSEQTQKTINYSILERDVETNRQLYDTLLQKAREADIATAMRGSNARIIDLAETPLAPSKPNYLWNTLLGAMAGLMFGLVWVVAHETLDRSFKVPGDMSLHLNLPELGVIPAGNALGRNGYGRYQRLAGLGSAGAPPPPPSGPVELVTLRDKSSVIAESFRSVVTSIMHSAENGTAPRVILVSSAIREEGKTTVVSNLGIALSEIEQKVLLIDGDLRKPRLHEVFNVPNDWGLSDLLREKSSLRECPLEALVKRTGISELNILTSGPGTSTVSNLLYSHRMLELLQRLRSEFDIVLIDTPPLLDITDARILGRLADAAVLVFRAGKTSRDAALAAKRRLTDDGIPVLGTILNGWDVKQTGAYGYGYSPYDYYSPSS
jgi:capsular exopolysaccharide synthesis family protein